MSEENKETTPAAAPQPEAAQSAGPAAYDIPAGKAPLDKRIIAFLIDIGLTIVVGLVPILGQLVGAAYWLVRDGLDIEFMDHRSIGKKIMKLRPVTLEGKPLTIQDSVYRNWPFVIGIVAIIPIIGWLLIIPVVIISLILIIAEAVLVLTDEEGRRLGDKTANTKVIESEK